MLPRPSVNPRIEPHRRLVGSLLTRPSNRPRIEPHRRLVGSLLTRPSNRPRIEPHRRVNAHPPELPQTSYSSRGVSTQWPTRPPSQPRTTPLTLFSRAALGASSSTLTST